MRSFNQQARSEDCSNAVVGRTRSKLVILGAVLAFAALPGTGRARSAVTGCNGFVHTPGQIGGTHFKSSPARHSELWPGIRGTQIVLSGYVFTSACRPVGGARIDFWQADESGAYDDSGTRLRSHQFTNGQGHYWLQTILPGPYANRTRHLHVTVRVHGERAVTTMLYFPGVLLNAKDPFFDKRLLVRLRIVKHRFQARFDFVLSTR
jgi:protocatechuate 3,4-dioxygenase beta subunit